MTFTKKCEWCGVEFEYEKTNHRPRRFCCRKCKDASRRADAPPRMTKKQVEHQKHQADTTIWVRNYAEVQAAKTLASLPPILGEYSNGR